MSRLNSFDVAYKKIIEASARKSEEYILDNELVSIFKEYCAGFDTLNDEFGFELFDVSVNEDMTLSVKTSCMDIVVSEIHSVLYDLMERAISVKFYTTGEDVLNTDFVLPSLWRRLSIED